MEEGKGARYLASGPQYGNALLGVRHQEEEEVSVCACVNLPLVEVIQAVSWWINKGYTEHRSVPAITALIIHMYIPKSFLSGSVPYLQLHRFTANVHDLAAKLNADSVSRIMANCTSTTVV